jgi:hypothetical protein
MKKHKYRVELKRKKANKTMDQATIEIIGTILIFGTRKIKVEKNRYFTEELIAIFFIYFLYSFFLVVFRFFLLLLTNSFRLNTLNRGRFLLSFFAQVGMFFCLPFRFYLLSQQYPSPLPLPHVKDVELRPSS